MCRLYQIQGDHSPGKPGKVREFQSGQGKWKKSGEMKSTVFFQALNTPKLVFFGRGSAPDPTGGAYNAPPDPLVGWGGRHPIPFPQLLQPQLLNNWLSSLTLFFINMKQRLLTISVNTRYRVIFTCLYWKSQWISCGLESGHPAHCVVETVNFSLKWGMSTCNVLTLWVTVFLVHLFVWGLIHHMSVTVSSQ